MNNSMNTMDNYKLNVQATPMPITFPMRPMNGSRLELRTEEFLERHDWEPKINDWRLLIHRPTGAMWNRYGERFTDAEKFTQAFEQLNVQFPEIVEYDWFDCLAMGRRTKIGAWSLFLLDLPNCRRPYLERRAIVETYTEIIQFDVKPEPEQAYCLQRWVSPKLNVMRLQHSLLQAVNAHWGEEFYEGLVAKRAASKYTIQTQSPDKTTADWIKFRWRY